MKKNILIISAVIIVLVTILANCNKDDNTLSDLEQVAALKNVTLLYDSAGYELGLPDGALSGKSFEQLRLEDSAKYTNPENYTITLTSNFTADNTKENSKDARFEGMDLTQILDTIESSPIETTAGPFEVMKKSSLPVGTSTEINLKTHMAPGLYIFQQIVDGEDLATTSSASLNYKIGSLSGSIPLPDLHQNIPTRASEETKEFLRGLIESGVFVVTQEVQ